MKSDSRINKGPILQLRKLKPREGKQLALSQSQSQSPIGQEFKIPKPHRRGWVLDSPRQSFLSISASSAFLPWLLICQLLRSQDPRRDERWLFLPALYCVRVSVINGVELSTLQVFTEGWLQPHPQGLPTGCLLRTSVEPGLLAQLEFEWQKQSSKMFIVHFNGSQEGVSLGVRPLLRIKGCLAVEGVFPLELKGSQPQRLTWDVSILAGIRIILCPSLALTGYRNNGYLETAIFPGASLWEKEMTQAWCQRGTCLWERSHSVLTRWLGPPPARTA